MWTAANRPKYNRDKLRYPSDLTDEEWSYVEPLIPPAKHGGRGREVKVREVLNGITAQHQRLVVVLEVAGVEAFVRTWPGLPGRPLKDRHALARSFVAKAVLGLATTAALIERLAVDRALRRLCGWERAASVPGESTFSRAFAEFARSGLPGRAHEALIKQTHKDRLVGHISRDATAIEAREKPARTTPAEKSAEAQARSAEKGRRGASEGAKALRADGTRRGKIGQHRGQRHVDLTLWSGRRAVCWTCSGRLGGAAAAGRTMVRSPAAPSPIPL